MLYTIILDMLINVEGPSIPPSTHPREISKLSHHSLTGEKIPAIHHSSHYSYTGEYWLSINPEFIHLSKAYLHTYTVAQ